MYYANVGRDITRTAGVLRYGSCRSHSLTDHHSHHHVAHHYSYIIIRFRRTGASRLSNIALGAAVGVVSGYYIFAAPLKQYWEEKERQDAAAASSSSSATSNQPSTSRWFWLSYEKVDGIRNRFAFEKWDTSGFLAACLMETIHLGLYFHSRTLKSFASRFPFRINEQTTAALLSRHFDNIRGVLRFALSTLQCHPLSNSSITCSVFDYYHTNHRVAYE